ncbi:MAG: PAS domain-containing protein [bacterium]|nr:PAS domain-containing protein [bacterium]
MNETTDHLPVTSEVCHGHCALTIVRSDGVVIYRNTMASELFGRNVQVGSPIAAVLTSPSDWEAMMAKLIEGAAVIGEPVVVQTTHNDTDIAYLTIYPDRDESGELSELICVWSSYKERLTTLPETADAGTLSQYVHDLEKMIEHRAYQQMLAAEQNEYLSEVAEVLPMGLVVATVEGDVIYRNRAMMEDYGLRSSDYGRPHVRYFLSREVCELFAEVGRTGLRRSRTDHDPQGLPVDVDILPLLRAGDVARIMVLFNRPVGKGEQP